MVGEWVDGLVREAEWIIASGLSSGWVRVEQGGVVSLLLWSGLCKCHWCTLARLPPCLSICLRRSGLVGWLSALLFVRLLV